MRTFQLHPIIKHGMLPHQSRDCLNKVIIRAYFLAHLTLQAFAKEMSAWLLASSSRASSRTLLMGRHRLTHQVPQCPNVDVPRSRSLDVVGGKDL